MDMAMQVVIFHRYYSGNNMRHCSHSGESRNPEYILLDAGSSPA
jgi:hypothetical protein